MPEGVAAGAILRFLDALERREINMHGMILLRDGRVAAQGYWKPFGPETPHRMFSISKSMVSLAIGILEGEGRLSLDDRIAGYFPDKLPKALPGPIGRITIRDMLRMATAHRFTTYKCVRDDDWTRTFFTAQPTNEPGAVFAYDTSSSHTLAALVERLSGQSTLSFLKARVFDRLGITGEMRWLTDPVGVCQGGSGLIMTLADLARVAALCLRGGDGLVPEAYLREATQKQIDTPLQAGREERFGYGYQFWRTRHDGYAMYGMGGQLALCFPLHGAALCTVADTRLDPSGVEAIHEAFFAHILPALERDEAETPADIGRLAERLAALAMRPVPHAPSARGLCEGRYRMRENNMGLTALTVAGDEIIFEHGARVRALPLAHGAFARGLFPGSQEPSLISSGMQEDGRLRLIAHLIGDTPCGMEMQVVSQGERVTVQARAVDEPALFGFSGVASGDRA